MAFPAALRTARFWKWTYFTWFVILCILSSLSKPGPHIDIVGIDKVEHFTYFTCGGIALGLALSLRPNFTIKPLALAGIIALVGSSVGWFDEWHQSFTPGRSGLDVYDWIADLLGSLCAGCLIQPIRRRLLRNRTGETG